MRYQEVDRRPLHLVGPWSFTLDRWYTEGLPRDVDLNEHLGVTPMQLANVSPNTWLDPPFERKIIREDEEFVYEFDNFGRTARYFKDHDSMPEWIDFPVKDRDSLRRCIDEHYQVEDLEARFPDNWEQTVRQAGGRDNVVMIDCCCYYWTRRAIAGG